MAYDRKWHQKNYPRLKQEKVLRRRRNLKIIQEARTGSCTRCPESDSRCLDFHHVDPKSKSFSLGSSVARDSSEAKLREELAKCVLLCANCHRKEHIALVEAVC